mmetsp:Transcript_39560/g.71241  ORF Transcript_39560/g.71241 Transcript_39560/m.71241 type:complete len:243 (+) Transcript_39560:1008-1736(+)
MLHPRKSLLVTGRARRSEPRHASSRRHGQSRWSRCRCDWGGAQRWEFAVRAWSAELLFGWGGCGASVGELWGSVLPPCCWWWWWRESRRIDHAVVSQELLRAAHACHGRNAKSRGIFTGIVSQHPHHYRSHHQQFGTDQLLSSQWSIPTNDGGTLHHRHPLRNSPILPPRRSPPLPPDMHGRRLHPLRQHPRSAGHGGVGGGCQMRPVSRARIVPAVLFAHGVEGQVARWQLGRWERGGRKR